MFFGTLVYWNSYSADELGFLTVSLIERSFRKLSYDKMRGIFFPQVSLFLNRVIIGCGG